MTNSRKLTARLRHNSPDRAARLRLAAIAEGCDTKNGLTQPKRTTDSHANRMTANDAIPRTTGADFIFQPSIFFLPAFAPPTWPSVRTEKPATRRRASSRFGIPNHNA